MTTTYMEKSKELFALGKVVDGYNGHWLDVGFHWDSKTGRTYCITPWGSFGYRRPGCHTDISASIHEAYENLQKVEWKYLHHLEHSHMSGLNS